jgi:hypothetical protein
MNLVLDQLKGVLSDSIAKFLKENIKLDDTDIKTIFGDNMDKVLYHDEGFLKDLSSKMSDVVMPAYMKELRYLKKIVSGVDEVTKSMKTLQDRMEKEMAAVVPNPKNVKETTNKMNKIVEEFIKKATEITQTKIGLREVLPEEKTISGEYGKTGVSSFSPVQKSSPTANVIKPIENAVLSTPSDITNALNDEILNIINQQKTKRGGASAQSVQSAQRDQSGDLQSAQRDQSGDLQSAQRDLQSLQTGGATKMPDIEPQINKYIESHEKVPRIPKRNYTEYDGNLSQLLNQIIREKMTKYEDHSNVLSDEILNSKSYKDMIASVNELYISKSEMQAEAINQLVHAIKESKISDKALQKIMDNTTKQIKSTKGGTRKKR